jgi:hypothetical protein
MSSDNDDPAPADALAVWADWRWLKPTGLIPSLPDSSCQT